MTHQPPDEPNRAGSTRSILVIEDNPSDAKQIERALEVSMPEAQTFSVDHLDAASALIKEKRFDCVILDWFLPDGLGALFLEACARISPELPVIVMTGRADNNDLDGASEALLQGAQDYLHKDHYTPESIARAVNYAIIRKRSAQLSQTFVRIDRLRSIGQLAIGITHELANPTGWVMSNFEFIEELLDEHEEGARILLSKDALEEANQLTRESIAGMKRIADIVRAVRAYSDATPDKLEPVDVHDALQQALRLTHNNYKHHVDLICLFKEDLPRVEGDIGALIQGFVQAIMNAIEAIKKVDEPREHKLTVTTRSEPGWVIVQLEDTGIGLPDVPEEELFEAFRAYPPGGQNNVGMGLAILADVLFQHKGSARFLPHEKRGACLEIRLPRIDTPRRRIALASEREQLDILVISGYEEVRGLLEAVFGEHHHITGVDNIDAAAKLMRGGAMFDGVLISPRNPEPNWEYILACFDRFMPDALERIVVCDSSTDNISLNAFLAATNARLLHTPFDVTDLEEVLLHWLELEAGTRAPKSS